MAGPLLPGQPGSPLATLRRLWTGTEHLPAAAVRDWRWTVAFGVATAATIAFVDRPAANAIHNYDEQHDSKAVSNDLLLIAEPGEVLADGFFLRRPHRSFGRTILLTATAVGYASAAVLALKHAAGRERPYLQGDGDGGFWQGGTSFPSGHAMASFTIGSLLAHRFPHHAWVAWLAYGLAATDAVLRYTGKQHFPSDLLAGSVLGYLVGRCAVDCR